jgi:hypothetical protein
VFAVAFDWPGWCRRGKGVGAALDELDAYRDRYAAAVTPAFAPGPLEVIGTVPGNRRTDFGAPDARGPWDSDPPTGAGLERQVGLLADAWAYLDAVAAASPEHLTKSPRGGGRDRDAVLDHVREAERAYCAKIGTRVPPHPVAGPAGNGDRCPAGRAVRHRLAGRVRPASARLARPRPRLGDRGQARVRDRRPGSVHDPGRART